MEEEYEKVDLITLLRTFKKEELDNFIVIRKEKFNNYIPKSKIKEKIEEIYNELDEKYSAEKISIFSGNTYMEKFKLLGAAQVLQELLEEE